MPPSRRSFSSLDCSVCYEEFDTKDHTPWSGTCGHSLCASCSLRISNCPVCQKENAFVSPQKNYTVLSLLEEKLTEERSPKRQQNGCTNCNNPFNSAKAHICVVCLREKKCTCLDDMMKEAEGSKKLCAKCARAVVEHHGHRFQLLDKTKDIIRSKKLQLKMEDAFAKAKRDLDHFQTASQIARNAYQMFIEKCTRHGRLNGDTKQFSDLAELMAKDATCIFGMLPGMSHVLWLFTEKCMRSAENISKEKKKMQARNFGVSESSLFRGLPDLKRREGIAMSPLSRQKVTKWKKLSMEKKRQLAVKMHQFFHNNKLPEHAFSVSGSEGRDDE